MFCDPEYIIENHPDKTLCIIFDPVSGGEYYSFEIDWCKPKWLIKTKIQQYLSSATHEQKRMLGII